MAETIQTLGELSALKPAAAPEPPKYVQKLDKQGRAYATGKRKDAVARVWVKLGAGQILINDRPVETYFARPVLRMLIQQPLVAANRQGQYDVVCTVSGGGLSGQAGAVRHGLSKALMRHEPDLRGVLKRGGFLTAQLARGGAKEIRPRQSASQLPVLQALTATFWSRGGGCLPPRVVARPPRIRSGAVLLLLRDVDRDGSMRRIDFVAFFVLFRDSFSTLTRVIFCAFQQSFGKTGSAYHTDRKPMAVTR